MIHHLVPSVCFREGFVSDGVDVTFAAVVPVKFPTTVGTTEEKRKCLSVNLERDA